MELLSTAQSNSSAHQIGVNQPEGQPVASDTAKIPKTTTSQNSGYQQLGNTPADRSGYERLQGFRFNLFKGGIKITKPTQAITLAEFVHMISGPAYQISIAQVRNQADESTRRSFKSALDYVTPSGLFTPTRKASNLLQHSALAILDFDHVANLETTRLQLSADPYALVLFVSPSGDGLKLIVNVTPGLDKDSHKQLYADLSLYYKQTYGLDQILDDKTSDVSRPCYVSYDPDVIVNPTASLYTSKGLVTTLTRKKPKTDYQLAADATDIERHVATVIERIEAAQINITDDDYHTWYVLAFCLSTLGESGRDYFHRLSQLSPKYDAANTEHKFDEALKNCRFTTPWKFFDVAKAHGINVSKGRKAKPIQQGNETVEHLVSQIENRSTDQRYAVDQTVTKSTSDNDRISNGTVTYDKSLNEIRIKSGKNGFNKVAENFLLYVKYLAEDEHEQLTWILEIQPATGHSVFLEVSHEEFNSASKLKRTISGKQFALKITDAELSELHAFLFTRTSFSRATKILRYGYDAPSGVFFFANKAVNVAQPGPLLLPDTFGMVQIEQGGRKLHLSMPANNKHKANRFTLTEQRIAVNDFFRVYAQAHGYENALIPFCFYLMALYRDLALKHKNFSPILFLKGGYGTGKSSMIKVLTAAFGRKQDGVNLKARNTEPALSKLMSQSSNTIIWFDEYHNDITCEGLLQAAYDNDGYHITKAGTVGTNETGSIDIFSALALTSNYIPANEIFFSRCVFVSIASQDKTAQQVVAFNQLEEWQEAGLGGLTVELLQHRAFVENEYGFTFDVLLKRLKAAFTGERIPERFFTNMAQLLTVGLILTSEGLISLTEFTAPADVVDEFVRIGTLNIRRQYRIMAEKTALSEFFEIIQQLYDQYQIHEEIHFCFKHIGETWTIQLWFPQLYNLYAQHYRRIYQKAPADRDGLQQEIAAFEEQADWDAVKKQIRFLTDGESNSQAKTMPRPNSCTMNYSKLQDKFGLNLEDRKSRN